MAERDSQHNVLGGAADRIGDILITFGLRNQPVKGRFNDMGWTSTPLGHSMDLWLQEPSTEWYGYPLKVIRKEPFLFLLLGELYNCPNTNQTLELIADDFDHAKELNGHFLLLAWNEHSGMLHILTNRFGTLHGYYTEHQHQTAIGTSFRSVTSCGSGRDLDWYGLASFFACGFFIRDSTFYKDTKVFEPASHYVFNANGTLLQQSRYWNWEHNPSPTVSRSECLNRIHNILREVLSEHTATGKIALPISGGLDSRTILAVIPEEHLSRIWSYSYGYGDNSIETRIAEQLTSKRTVVFEAFSIPPYLLDRLGTVVSCTEAFQDITQCRQASIIDRISSRADRVLGGHMGDLWFGTMGLDAKTDWTDSQICEQALQKLLKRGHPWLLDHLCQPYLKSSEIYDALREEIGKALQSKSNIEDHDFRLKALKTDLYCFRFTSAGLRMFQASVFPRLPFYDTRLTDFFGTLDTSLLSGRKLQGDLIKRFAPDLAEVRWQAHDANLFNYDSIWQPPKRALKKIWRLVSGTKVYQRNWEVQFLGAQQRKHLEEYLNQSRLLQHQFISPQRVSELLNEFYQRPDPGNGYAVSMLLTFAAWLESYAS